MSEKPKENKVAPRGGYCIVCDSVHAPGGFHIGEANALYGKAYQGSWTPTRHWFELEWAYLQRESRHHVPLDLTDDDLAHVQLTTAHGARAWLRDRLEKARLHAHNAPAA